MTPTPNPKEEAREIIESLIQYDAWRDNLHPNDFSTTRRLIEKALEIRDQEIAVLKEENHRLKLFENKKMVNCNHYGEGFIPVSEYEALKQENDKLRLPYIQETRTQVLKEKLYQSMEQEIQDLKRELEELKKRCEGLAQSAMNNGQGLLLLESKLGVAREALKIAINTYEVFLLRGDISEDDRPRAKRELKKFKGALTQLDGGEK